MKGRRKLNFLMLSDLNVLLDSIQNDFPDMTNIQTLGFSYEKRPIRMITLDARDHILKQTQGDKPISKIKQEFHTKPTIVITG
jgi:carboxypeptidase T